MVGMRKDPKVGGGVGGTCEVAKNQTQHSPSDFGSSNVATFGSSDVASFGSSDLASFGSSDVASFGSSDVASFGSSDVASFGSSDVASFGSSDVASFGSSDVASFGSSDVASFGSSNVACFGSSDVGGRFKDVLIRSLEALKFLSKSYREIHEKGIKYGKNFKVPFEVKHQLKEHLNQVSGSKKIGTNQIRR
ncbi:hypothetical protein Lal_00015798 [Lupinus albus]|nr:hypothetical protein Lal_00015798 [Lupinus albus]